MARADAARLTPRAGRRFAFAIGGMLLMLAALSRWRGRHTLALVLLGLGVALMLAGALAPGRLGPVHAAWMAVGRALSKITTPVVLGAVYVLVVTPFALVARLFGRHPLRHRPRDNSYWAALPSGGRSDLGKQF